MGPKVMMMMIIMMMTLMITIMATTTRGREEVERSGCSCNDWLDGRVLDLNASPPPPLNSVHSTADSPWLPKTKSRSSTSTVRKTRLSQRTCLFLETVTTTPLPLTSSSCLNHSTAAMDRTNNTSRPGMAKWIRIACSRVTARRCGACGMAGTTGS